MNDVAKVPAIHEEFVWPNMDGLDLNLEQKIALGRCGNESAFHNMIESMRHHVAPCVFCSLKLRGNIIFNLPSNSWYIFTPPL